MQLTTFVKALLSVNPKLTASEVGKLWHATKKSASIA